MPWEPDFIEDGAAANALSVTSILDDGSTWINAITRAGVRRGAFNHVHALSAITQADTSTLTVRGDHGIHEYTFAVFTASLTYNAYGQDDGTDDVGNLGTGDRILVGHVSQTGPYNGPEAIITFDDGGYRVGMANGDRCAGILVHFNVQIRYFEKDVGDIVDHEYMFCIQFQLDGAGTWFTINVTESFMSIEDHMLAPYDEEEDINLDVPISTLITEAMVEAVGAASTDKVSGVRAMFSVVEGKAGSNAFLERWNLSAIPIFGSDP